MNEPKSWWSLAEVCELTALEPHVLRYWESEFSQLRPRKGRNGARQYREKDLQLVQKIRELLFDEHLTIQAARRRLAEDKTKQENPDQLGLALGLPDLPDTGPRESGPLDTEKVIESLRDVLDILRFGRRSW